MALDEHLPNSLAWFRNKTKSCIHIHVTGYWHPCQYDGASWSILLIKKRLDHQELNPPLIIKHQKWPFASTLLNERFNLKPCPVLSRFPQIARLNNQGYQLKLGQSEVKPFMCRYKHRRPPLKKGGAEYLQYAFWGSDYFIDAGKKCINNCWIKMYTSIGFNQC